MPGDEAVTELSPQSWLPLGGLEVAAWDSGMVTVLPTPCQNTQLSSHLLSMETGGMTLTPGDTLINQPECP